MRTAAAALALAGGAHALAQAPAGAAVEIAWKELIPDDWDPFKDQKDKPAGLAIMDGSPQALKQMREMRAIWDNAPTKAELNGRNVKLPGYVVPLQEAKDGMTEFLLVPYFGACIHTPPPPANQIVHVTLAKPVKGYHTMDVVWVTGIINTARIDSEMGTSGYRLMATAVAAYKEPRR